MAPINEETIKRVRSENDIVDVIGEYLTLKPKGKNYFCLCPFHDDHSPSMSVSREKQIFSCFVCGATGNVITFIKDYQNVSFVEAVKILAGRIGLKLNINEKKENLKYKDEYEIYDIALKYYKNNLNTKSGALAREYLEKRKLTKEIIDRFDIGLSLNGGLVNSLEKKYSKDKLIDLGLSNTDGTDLFKNRVMFTIKDNYGNAVGFSGRIYQNENLPKYINSKETVIFKKGKVLYNYYQSKDEIKKDKEIIISEGFMEVIRLYSIGIKNVVALMGTSFTNDHLEIIKNLKVNVVLNLDQDEAGKIATIKIGETLLNNGITPTVIIFNGAKDADELIVEKGEEAFLNAYKNKVSFIDFKLDYLKRNKDLSKEENLASYLKEAVKSIDELDDDLLKEIKIKNLSEKYNINIDVLKSRLTKKIKKEEPKLKKEEPKLKYNGLDKCELRLLYLMLNDISVINYYENHLGYMNNPKRMLLANEIIKYKEANKTFDYADFISYTTLNSELSQTLKEVMMSNQKEEHSIEEIEEMITKIKEQRVKMTINKLKEEQKNTLDIEEKAKIAARIENMKKEVLKW